MAESGLFATYVDYAAPGSSVLGQVPLGAVHAALSGTAAQHRVTNRSSPGDLRNFYLNVTVNSNANTVTVTGRHNGSIGNLSIAIAGGATGVMTDLTGTDSIADGDTFNMAVSVGLSGAAIAFLAGVQFGTSGQFMFQPAAGSAGGSNVSIASASGFCPSMGLLVHNSTENVCRQSALGAVTLSKLQFYVSANARSTDTVIVSRNNAADGNQTATVAAGATGLFEDTSNSDSVSDGNYYSTKFTTGTGTGNLTTRYCSYRVEVSGDSRCPVYGNGGISLAAGASVQRSFVSNTRTGGLPVPAAAQASSLYIDITGNTTSGAGSCTLRIGGSNTALSAVITSGATGRFIDTTNVVDLAAGDLIDVDVVAGATGTTLTVREYGMLIVADKIIDTVDSLLPKTDEASVNLLLTTPTDSLLPKITETSVNALLLAVTDTLLPKTVEAAALLSLLARGDELLVKLTELADVDTGSSVVPVDVVDTLLPKLTETVALVVQLVRTDTLLPKLTEVAALMAEVTASDSLLVKITEALDAVAALSRADTLSPKITETVTLLSLLSRADTLLPLVTDLITVQAALATTDTLLPKTTEVATLAQTLHLAVTDTLRPKTTELASIITALARAVAAGVDIRPLVAAFPELGPMVDALGSITVKPKVDAVPDIGAYSGHGPRGRR